MKPDYFSLLAFCLSPEKEGKGKGEEGRGNGVWRRDPGF